MLRRSLKTRGALPARLDEEEKLRPAELAYIARDGDMGHVFMVLVFDLLHRAIKSQLSESVPAPTNYERKLWSLVKEYTGNWAKGEIAKVLPNPKREPVRFLKAFSRIFHWLAQTIKSFSRETIADPRRLRRYITWSGLVGLTADFWSAGYQDAVEQEMVADLRARGLLTEDASRGRHAFGLNVMATAGIIAIAALGFISLGSISAASAGFIGSGIAAICLRGIWLLRDWIPLYHELNMALANITRGDWKLRIARVLVTLVTSAVVSTFIVCSALLIGAQVLLLHFAVRLGLIDSWMGAICFTLIWSLCLQMAVEAHRIRWRHQITAAANEDVRIARMRLSHLSPLKVFADLLSHAEYDPALSELIALYGIETLWLLL